MPVISFLRALFSAHALRGLLAAVLIITAMPVHAAVGLANVPSPAPTNPTVNIPDVNIGLTTSQDSAPGAASSAAPATSPASQSAGTQILGQNTFCNPEIAKAFDSAREKALTIELSRDNKFFKYQIAGAFAANCVGRLVGYAQQLSDGVNDVITAANTANGSPVVTAVTLIAGRILNQIFRQIVTNLENQVCSVTTQVTRAMDSVYQNAICVPTTDLGINGLFSFNIKNLNLPELQCDGIAINPLEYAQVDPSTGQPYSLGESALASGALGGGGIGGYASDGGGTFGLPDPRQEGDFGSSTNISGEPDFSTGWDEITTPVASGSVGSVCSGSGDVTSFVNALGARESGNGQSGDCQKSARIGLNVRSTNQYTCVNYAGFMGKYQMGEAVLHDLQVRGALPGYASSFGNCRPHPSTECNDQRYSNTNTLLQFMNDPAAQEKAIRAELDMNWAILKKRGAESLIGKTINGVLITKSGLLAAAHLIGAPGLMHAIATGKLTADGNGVKWIDYARRFANC